MNWYFHIDCLKNKLTVVPVGVIKVSGSSSVVSVVFSGATALPLGSLLSSSPHGSSFGSTPLPTVFVAMAVVVMVVVRRRRGMELGGARGGRGRGMLVAAARDAGATSAEHGARERCGKKNKNQEEVF